MTTIEKSEVARIGANVDDNDFMVTAKRIKERADWISPDDERKGMSLEECRAAIHKAVNDDNW